MDYIQEIVLRLFLLQNVKGFFNYARRSVVATAQPEVQPYPFLPPTPRLPPDGCER